MIEFASLQSRITALYTVAFGLVMLGVAATVQWVIADNAEEKVRQELSSSANVIDRFWTLRDQELEAVADPLARDFGFREAVATGDDETIRSALDNVAARMDLPNAFVVRYDGRVIGLGPSLDRDYDAEMWEALDAGWSNGALRVNGVTYQAVAAEITAPNLIGWLVIGRKIGHVELRQLGKLSAIPVHAALVRQSPEGSWIDDANDTPVDAPVAALLERMTHAGDGRQGTLSQSFGGKMVLVRPLGSNEGGTVTALLLDFQIAEALAQYAPLRWAVAIAGLIGLLLVGFASAILARRIVRPIAALERAARDLGRGESTQVPVAGNDEIAALTRSFNSMSGAIVEREQHIRHLAYHDPLTGLPNRLKLAEEIADKLQAIELKGGSLALLCIGLDGFKITNDTLGHAVGDEVLRIAARRIAEVAAGHLLAHLGSDQFCLVVEDGEEERLSSAIIAEIRRPMSPGSHSIRVGASIGIAVAPADAQTADDLVKFADLAMFEAKRRGRGKWCRFAHELDVRAQHRRALELDLHNALRDGQFVLHFQPLFDLATNRFSTFEALVRWQHPERGLIAPLEFIPVAEETGLIVPLGEWVLKEACRQATTWPDEIKVAVNFSSVQFQSRGLVSVVLNALASTGLAPERLEVEITESLFLDNDAHVLDVLHGLKKLGVRIALDDFGTGYSSLSYLCKFPFDKLKIDRSFIIELLERDDARAVVQAITDLAAALDMETTAEGVEDPDQVAVLREHGCTNVQGYYFSKPIPGDQVLALIGETHARKTA
jgi:diguanylate cyclase (GGDEF)-like protein